MSGTGCGASEVLARVDGALKNAGAMHDDMSAHHLWVVRGILDNIDPETDLAPAELLALLSVLAPVHTRVLARRSLVDIAAPPLSSLSVVH